MDTQLKDICGTPFKVGDLVATDVTRYRSSALRVGTVTSFDGKYIKVQYNLDERRKNSVTRTPSGVVKVDKPEAAQ